MGIHKKVLGSRHNRSSLTTLTISNDEIYDIIIKIVKSLESSGLLLKGVTETVQNEVKDQKGGLLIMLLGTLGASLLGNILTGLGEIAKKQDRGINRAGDRAIATRQGRGIVRASYSSSSSKMDF